MARRRWSVVAEDRVNPVDPSVVQEQPLHETMMLREALQRGHGALAQILASVHEHHGPAGRVRGQRHQAAAARIDVDC